MRCSMMRVEQTGQGRAQTLALCATGQTFHGCVRRSADPHSLMGLRHALRSLFAT